jgi:hypothetical protein
MTTVTASNFGMKYPTISLHDLITQKTATLIAAVTSFYTP